MFCILIKISLKLVADGPIDNKPSLVRVMAWHLTDDMPLPESMLTQFTDAHMRQYPRGGSRLYSAIQLGQGWVNLFLHGRYTNTTT